MEYPLPVEVHKMNAPKKINMKTFKDGKNLKLEKKNLLIDDTMKLSNYDNDEIKVKIDYDPYGFE